MVRREHEANVQSGLRVLSAWLARTNTNTTAIARDLHHQHQHHNHRKGPYLHRHLGTVQEDHTHNFTSGNGARASSRSQNTVMADAEMGPELGGLLARVQGLSPRSPHPPCELSGVFVHLGWDSKLYLLSINQPVVFSCSAPCGRRIVLACCLRLMRSCRAGGVFG